MVKSGDFIVTSNPGRQRSRQAMTGSYVELPSVIRTPTMATLSPERSPQEFRRRAIELIRSGQSSMNQIAKDLEVVSS